MRATGVVMAAILLVAAAPPPLAVDADAPIDAVIAGQPVALSLSTGGVDRILLNEDTVARLGLKPGTIKGKNSLQIGNSRVLAGRNTVGTITLAGTRFEQRLLWFEGAAPRLRQGSIGPMALPQTRLTVRLPAGPGGSGAVLRLPLHGDLNSGSYGTVRGEDYGFGLSIAVEERTRLPLASAALGADLAAALGGRMVGEPWDEDILLGLRRPVRRLVLDRPLVIGPLRFTEIAVRVTDLRDGTALLASDQQAAPDADSDPAETVVTASSGKPRPVVRVLTVSRTQLEAQGCREIMFDKAEKQLALTC